MTGSGFRRPLETLLSPLQSHTMAQTVPTAPARPPNTGSQSQIDTSTQNSARAMPWLQWKRRKAEFGFVRSGISSSGPR